MFHEILNNEFTNYYHCYTDASKSTNETYFVTTNKEYNSLHKSHPFLQQIHCKHSCYTRSHIYFILHKPRESSHIKLLDERNYFNSQHTHKMQLRPTHLKHKSHYQQNYRTHVDSIPYRHFR